jgi:hypothetical protein
MAGRKSIFTPEMQELILNNFRQTGNLKNSAIRAGMSERSFYRWKELCEKAKSGPLYRFWQEVTRAKANRLALLASRHYQRAVGGVFRLPVYAWAPGWDMVFAGASAALAGFYGAAIGNVVRGVPLDNSGYFFLPLWTNLRVGKEVGILDWFTIIIGLATFFAMGEHGALWVR